MTIRAVRLERAAAHRRRARRGALHDVPPIIGFHPDRARRGRAGHREDRGLAVVRRRQRLRVVPLLGEPTPIALVANEMRRDSNTIWQGNDLVAFIFDTFYDRRNARARSPSTPIGGRQRRPDDQRAAVQRRLEPDLGRRRPAGSTAAGPSRRRSRSSRCATAPGARRSGASTRCAPTGGRTRSR